MAGPLKLVPPRVSGCCLPALHFNISESLSGELLGDAVGQRG